MRKALCVFVLMITVTLVSCKNVPDLTDPAKKIAEYYQGVSSVSMNTAVEINHGDTFSKYTLSVSGKNGGDTVFSVLEPEEIKGVGIIMDADGIELKYDGVVLETGLPAGTTAPPLKIIGRVIGCFERQVTLSAGKERLDNADVYKVMYEDIFDQTTCIYEIFYDAKTYIPLEANIFTDDLSVMSLKFSEFLAA